MQHIYALIVLSIGDLKDLDVLISFNIDSLAYVCDNFSNAHNWNNEVSYVLGLIICLEKSAISGVAIIGGVELIPHSISHLNLFWNDDLVK